MDLILQNISETIQNIKFNKEICKWMTNIPDNRQIEHFLDKQHKVQVHPS